jgi:hypothetical protein
MRATKRPDHPLTEASFHNPSDSARSARPTRAVSVDRIDISDNSAVVPLQSAPPEIRRSELTDDLWTKIGIEFYRDATDAVFKALVD